ncbi:unnamed protein product [Caenorhabditis bovis]|uniref:RNA-splicing ligase RtcB homolog n=1 Tax=Caenorhabditis bovis TaxID=2654633 RepID=A0A8S1F4Y9_9PELO|nr:unnamed protein product [Caenorhabditis bovis]
MALGVLGNYRILANYLYRLADEFTPDTTPLHANNCKCTIADRLWCDYFGMGTCISKEARARRRERRRIIKQRLRDARSTGGRGDPNSTSRHTNQRSRSDATQDIRDDIKALILETLEVIRTLVNNEQEPPQSLLKLNFIADEEKGWIMVVKALIHTIPDNDPLGPAVISLFLDECPLPSKESVQSLLVSLRLSADFVDATLLPPAWHKNMCIVLGSLAEKMAGTAAVAMFNDNIRGYLMRMIVYGLLYNPPAYPKALKERNTHAVRMFALLALEKFAQTRENQITICKMLTKMPVHPLIRMEEYLRSENLERYWFAKQEGFCAQWALDNIFVTEGRPYSYETCDTSKINAMLNHEDVSEYLKIGPDGLEARCDVSSFESVRCTFEVIDGVWYYEATVLTSGVMQIGLATKRSRFLNHEGYGIGDDASSVAYDGCRQLIWYNARSTRHEHPNWQSGDTVGILLDIPNGEVAFYLNGVRLKEANREFLANRLPSEGVFAAASFMSFQQCRFNFGATRFKFNPGCEFRCFNDYGSLSHAQRTIMPRRMRLEQLEKEQIPDDYCTICFAEPATTLLTPCNHEGFCQQCALQMDQCPLCRAPIEERTSKSNRSFESSFIAKSPSQTGNNSLNDFVRTGSQRKSMRASSFQPANANETMETVGMPRTLDEELKFIKPISPSVYGISKGFVPNMNVDAKFYANDNLMALLNEELHAEKFAAVGGFLPATKQIANVAALPGIVGSSVGLPDIHSGYGFSIGNVAAFDVADPNSIISPGGVGFDINCGVRLIRTNLHESDLKDVKETLTQSLFDHIPVGVGSKGAIPMSAADLVDCLEMGMDWTLREGYSWAEDKEYCEEYGRMLQADSSKVSMRAKKRGLPQLGTLGAGNHYAEIQVVDEIFDASSARTMGIDEIGQVVVMLHCGSRGLGHQVATDSLIEMEKAMSRDHIVVNDKQLACARINSQEGKNYYAGMAAAANFAWVNRSCITFCVRNAFERVFNMSADDMEMQLVYDVSHNVAKMEEHLVDGRPRQLCVHRKGATRAFPAHHPLIPVDYQLIGQPVLIGGSMGTASYVLTGTNCGMFQSFGTTCHGAGRALSRAKSRRTLNWESVVEDLKKKDISIRIASPKLIMEEASSAYKNVDDVVDTCESVGISKKTVKLRPIAVIKG